MTKDVATLFNYFKEEMKQEFKTLKVSLGRDFRNDIRETRADLREVKTSVTFINQTFEDTKQKFETVMSENAVLRQENETLCVRCGAMEKAAERKKKNVVRMMNCERYLRNQNAEIKGVPEPDRTNLTELLRCLGELVGEPILSTDIEICIVCPLVNLAKVTSSYNSMVPPLHTLSIELVGVNGLEQRSLR